MTETVVSGTAMTALYLQLVVTITFPVMALILIKVKTKASIMPFFVGGTIYVLFSLVILGLVHIATIMMGVSSYIDNSTVVYCTFHGIMTGLVEETGCFLAFKLILQNLDEKQAPIMYAIGFSGFETLTFITVPALSSATFATTFMDYGLDGMLAQISTEVQNGQNVMTAEDILGRIEIINSITLGQAGLVFAERLMFFIIHMALTVIIAYGVRKKYTSYLWIGVILCAISTVPSSLMSLKVLSNDIWGLVPLAAVAVLVSIPAVKLFKTDKDYENFFSLYTSRKGSVLMK